MHHATVDIMMSKPLYGKVIRWWVKKNIVHPIFKQKQPRETTGLLSIIKFLQPQDNIYLFLFILNHKQSVHHLIKY